MAAASTSSRSTSDRPAQADRTVLLGNLMHLIEGDLAATLARFADLVDPRAGEANGVAGSSDPTPAEVATLARAGAQLARGIVEMAELFPHDSLQAADEIRLPRIVAEACRVAARHDPTRHRDIRVDVRDPEMAALRGSRRWLEAAFEKLIERLIVASPGGTQIAVKVHQLGEHQIIAATTRQGSARAGQAIVARGTGSTLDALVAASCSDQLNLVLSSRIVELHGGVLKFDTDEDGALHGFVATLPVDFGDAPQAQPSCADCPVQHQAEMFARDIGMMMSALKVKPKE